MRVHKRHGSQFFHYEFELDGSRYRGSTKLTDRAEAEKVADAIYERTLATLGIPAPRFITQVRLSDCAYIVRGRLTGLLKIGVAINVEQRRRDLQCGSPDILELVWAGAGSRMAEHEAHLEFADLRSHGEWFRPDPRLDALIAACERTGDLFGALYLMRQQTAA